jgi:hypothetical protein
LSAENILLRLFENFRRFCLGHSFQQKRGDFGTLSLINHCAGSELLSITGTLEGAAI